MRLRYVLIAAGLVGLAIIVLTQSHNLADLWRDLIGTQWYLIIPAVAVIQSGSYYFIARYYRRFLIDSGYSVPTAHLFKIALAVNFADTVAPSAGMAGVAYMATATRPVVPTGTAVLAQLGNTIFSFLSFFIVLLIGWLALFFGRDINRISVRLVVLLLLIIIIGIALLLAAFAKRKRLKRLLRPFVNLTNFISRLFPGHRDLISPKVFHNFLDELYTGAAAIRQRRTWPRLALWALATNLTEVAVLYVVLVGLGWWLNPGVVIAAYALAILASQISLATNGFGAYEAAMTGTFVALGMPLAAALSAVLLYRVLSIVLFLPPGFYYYHKYLGGLNATRPS
jgi:uncharacterized protein (TIRG00374 family)